MVESDVHDWFLAESLALFLCIAISCHPIYHVLHERCMRLLNLHDMHCYKGSIKLLHVRFPLPPIQCLAPEILAKEPTNLF